MYYFLRITPANVLYALWLALRGPVAAWKMTIPDLFARRFQRVRPYRLWSRDEWLLAHDRAFDLWKEHAFPILSQRHRLHVRLGGRDIDFSRNVWQLLGIEFEALSLFISMLETLQPGAMPRVVEPWIARAFEREELAKLFPAARIVPSRANRWLESAYEWAVSAAHLGRTLVHAAASLVRPRRHVEPRPVAWLGISAVEIPSSDQRLNFSWVSQYGYLAPQEVVYFLPTRLTAAQREYLQLHGVEALDPAESFSVLRAHERLWVVARTIAGFFSALVRPSATAPYRARFMARAPHWNALFTALATRAYVTTTSYSWPEKPELAITNARGIRSIIWAYSANSLTFSIEDPRFRDVGVLRSIIVAEEFWVWNRAYAEWLRKRQVNVTEKGCDLRVVGSLMCGDPRLLELESRAARQCLGLPAHGICVGVFDMPLISDAWRDHFGGGPPMVDTETYIAFWEAIERIVSEVPESYALIKLKRKLGHAYREFPAVLRALIDPQSDSVGSGKVRVVDVNIDPYLPIAACDIAFGIAYTSPVLAARSTGRPAFYLDPLKRTNWPSHRDYKNITLYSADEAAAIVAALARDRTYGDATCARDAITPPVVAFPLNVHGEDAAPSEALVMERGCRKARPAKHRYDAIR